jgi:hypothetical protein
MRVHHLNCGTLRPLGGRNVNGDRPPFRSARMVCHCSLIEAGERLVLVDSGFGLADVERLRSLRAAARPRQLARHAYAWLVARPRLAGPAFDARVTGFQKRFEFDAAARRVSRLRLRDRRGYAVTAYEACNATAADVGSACAAQGEAGR